MAIVFGSMEFSGFYRQMVNALAEDHGVDINKPLKDLPEKFRQELLYGTGDRHLKYYYTSRQYGKQVSSGQAFRGSRQQHREKIQRNFF